MAFGYYPADPLGVCSIPEANRRYERAGGLGLLTISLQFALSMTRVGSDAIGVTGS